MGIENNTREIEVQNQELQRANREQIEQANKEHEELGKVLDGLDTLDNEAELDEISGNEDISEQDDAASQLDNNDKIEDEPSEQFETINNPVYNEVENNGFSINDVNQAVDAKEAYEAGIRDMSQDEYHDQKELDQRVEENGSEPNMTEPSVLDNDLHQGDVSNKETDNRSRLNEPEQDAVDMESSTEETPGNDEIDDSLSDVSTVDESNVQEVKLSELPDNVQESYRKYESDAENPEGAEDTESDTDNPDAGKLSPEDREKLDGWKYRPDDQLYLDNKKVFDNPKYYNQETGEINWPPNDGVVEGTSKNVTLEPGTKIDRYGADDGYYTAPIDTPYEERAVAPGTDQKPYSQFEVVKPIEAVEQGEVAPWFDQPGGGTQYLMPESIEDLIDEGYLRRI